MMSVLPDSNKKKCIFANPILPIMKKFFRSLVFILLFAPSLQTYATQQHSDYLIYNGDTLELSHYPLESYREAHPNPIYDTLFEEHTSTANRRANEVKLIRFISFL